MGLKNKKIMFSIVLALLFVIVYLTLQVGVAKETSTEHSLYESQLDVKRTYESEDTTIPEELINILLLGVDGTGFDSSKRSDVIMIATIDVSEKKVKLTSLSRDTLSYLPGVNSYEKLNHSYSKTGSKAISGPKHVMQTINANLDMDIEDYVVFDYNSVIKVVDFFKGYPANLSTQEILDMGKEGSHLEVGEQLLEGKDAINYMRIRKNSGGDPGRNQRQRDLIFWVMDQSRGMDKVTLAKLVTIVLPTIKTSFSFGDLQDLVGIYLSIKDGFSTEEYSYPFDFYGGKLDDGLWYAVPRTTLSNAVEFHKTVQGESDYIYSHKGKSYEKTLEEISEAISRKSGIR